MFQISEDFNVHYPDAHVGVLAIREVQNPSQHTELEIRKAALEQALQERYSGQDRAALLQNPTLQAYDTYYRRFKKTYHVQLQLESIVFKAKSIPTVAALVEAMFMAEIDHLLLTAGHDLDSLRLPLTLEVATGAESYTLLRGESQVAKIGDMVIRDGEGIISSILYGPDQRTRITEQTRNTVFTIYGPSGITAAAIEAQLEKIRDNILLFSPQASSAMLQVFGA